MRTIYKYEFEINDRFSLILPNKFHILKFGTDPNGRPCLWAWIDTEMTKNQRNFRCYGTGHEIDSSPSDYVDTFNQGPFVWHIFKDY